MTEQEYINATNLKAVRMVRTLLSEVLLSDALENERPRLKRMIDDLIRWEQRLKEVVKVGG